MYKKEQSCGIIPFFKKGQNYYFLIVKHNSWHRWFPKWHVELNESEVQTAKRELYEETGIENTVVIDNIKFLEKYMVSIEWKIVEKTVLYFLWIVSIDINTKIIIKDDEVSEYKIDTYDNVQKYLTYDSAKIILKEAFYHLNSSSND